MAYNLKGDLNVVRNATINNGLVVGSATGGNLGAGNINISGGYYINNTLFTGYSPTVNNQNAQASYTVLSTDKFKLLTFASNSSVAVSLPQATGSFGSGFIVDIENQGVGNVVVTPTTSTIDGTLALTIPYGSGLRIYSDGTNYYAVRGSQYIIPTINGQTGTTYTFLSTDRGRLVTFDNSAAVSVTLPQAGANFPAGWYVDVRNINNTTTSAVTITPTTSTINGGASATLTPSQFYRITSDGTNYTTSSPIVPTLKYAFDVTMSGGNPSSIINLPTGWLGSISGTPATTLNITTNIQHLPITAHSWGLTPSSTNNWTLKPIGSAAAYSITSTGTDFTTFSIAGFTSTNTVGSTIVRVEMMFHAY